MKKLLSIVVAAAFAAVSASAIAASHAGAGDKMDKKKEEVKAAQGAKVTTPEKATVTTGTDKPKREKGGPTPKNQGKRKTEGERTDKKADKK
jgi:Ni/Co efflux regulator RcnB